jgi:hypothetical protein
MKKKFLRMVWIGCAFVVSGCRSNESINDSHSLAVVGPGNKKIYSVYLDQDKKNTKSSLLWCAYEIENEKSAVINLKAWSISKSELNKKLTGWGTNAIAGGGGITALVTCAGSLAGALPLGPWCLGGIATMVGEGTVGGGAEKKIDEAIDAWKMVMDVEATKMNEKDYIAVYSTIQNSGNSNQTCEDVEYAVLKKKIDARIDEKIIRP